MIEGDMELMDLATLSPDLVPSHCQVERRPDGSLRAEIWVQTPDHPETWQYAMVKIPSLHG